MSRPLLGGTDPLESHAEMFQKKRSCGTSRSPVALHHSSGRRRIRKVRPRIRFRYIHYDERDHNITHPWRVTSLRPDQDSRKGTSVAKSSASSDALRELNITRMVLRRAKEQKCTGTVRPNTPFSCNTNPTCSTDRSTKLLTAVTAKRRELGALHQLHTSPRNACDP